MSDFENNKSHSSEWYQNKELFEQIQLIVKEVNEITKKLIILDNKIEKYNGLKQELLDVRKDLSEAQRNLNTLCTSISTEKDVHGWFIKWGGWAFGAIGTIVLLVRFFSSIG